MKHLKHARLLDHKGVTSTGGMTLLVEFKNGVYLVGWARCNPTDNFCKKTGRGLAAKRFDTAPIVLTVTNAVEFFREFNYPVVLTTEGKEKFYDTLDLKDLSVSVIFTIAEELVIERTR